MLTERARLAFFRALHGKGLTKLPGMTRIADALKRNRRQQSIVHGFPVQLDPKDVLRLSVFGVYEPLETEIVRAHVQPGDTVLDLGGHIGYYTLLFSKLVGPTGQVHSFEPTPDTFAILAGNLKRNGIRNVAAVNAAVADKNGEITLYVNPENCGDNHVFDSKGVPLSARMLSVDEYLPANQTVQFIKMDIQGAEPVALRGMENTLKRSKRVKMLVELSPHELKRAGFEAGAFLDQLISFGFTYRHVDRKSKQLVKRSKAEILSVVAAMHHTYLFCVKE